MSQAVQIENLTKRYGPKVAVDGFSLQVETGSIFAILGPNGAGKTTTVECCEGFRKPDFGVVRVLGLNPTRDGHRLRPRIGVMLQSGGVYPAVRAEEMLLHVAKLHAHPIDPSLLILRLALASAGKSAYRKRLMGWSPSGGIGPALVLLVLGTASFSGLGLLMAGTLRAEATLAVANLLFLLLLAGGGIFVPLAKFPAGVRPLLSLLPTAALSDGLRQSFGPPHQFPLAAAAVLLGWCAARKLNRIATAAWQELFRCQ